MHTCHAVSNRVLRWIPRCCVMLCRAMQGKPTVVFPGENYGFPRSWFVMERTRKTGESTLCVCCITQSEDTSVLISSISGTA